MDTKELLEAKKSLESRIALDIQNEIDSFHEQTGLTMDEINIHFAVFQNFDGSIGSISIDKVNCHILLE